MVSDKGQIIEVFRSGRFLGFGDTLPEGVPWNDGIDGNERIAARLLCVQQRTTDARVQTHFVVDRFA